jgi:UDP-2,3-diacylglucosamine pyrophosphatase LpxH
MEEKSVVFGDVHLPWHSDKAVLLLFKFIEFYQPDNIFINGDFIDCWEISRFTKPQSITKHLSEEFALGRDFLKTLRTLAPKAKIVYIFGNHEYRFEKFLAENAPEFHDIRGLSIREQLDCDLHNIEIVDNHLRENYYRFGHILIGHFNKCSKHAGYTAKALLDDKGMSLIQGHTHRLAHIHKRDYESIKAAVEGGCLCDPNPPYTSLPNWHLGFCTITTFENGFFGITLRPIIEYDGIFHLRYGDKIFKI